MSATPDDFRVEDVRVRLARDDDHAAILELFRAGALEGQLRENDTGADVEDLRQGYFSDAGASAFWVAEHDGRMVGMIGVQRIKDGEAEIRRLRVADDYRRRGVGTLLLRKATDFCRTREYLKVVLDVRIERSPAIAMFQKFGFVLARTRDRGDHQLMDFYMDLYREPTGSS